MAAEDYDLKTAKASPSIAAKSGTWEVIAQRRSDGRWCCISNSSEMTEDEAEAEANMYREDDEFI